MVFISVHAGRILGHSECGIEPPCSGRVGGMSGKLGSPSRRFPVWPREQQVPPDQDSLDLPWSKHQGEGNHPGETLRLVQLKLRRPREGE